MHCPNMRTFFYGAFIEMTNKLFKVYVIIEKTYLFSI